MDASTTLGAVLVGVVLALAWMADRRRPPSPSKFSQAQRVAAFDRARGQCEYCGVKLRMGPARLYWFDSRKPFECDHIVPASKGGPATLDNAAAACEPCNKLKFDLSWDEFATKFRQERGLAPSMPIMWRRWM